MPFADPLRALMALGVVAAIIPTGLRLVQGRAGFGRRQCRAEVWALAVPVGIAAWSLPLVAAAYAGLFEPAALGLLGWIAAVAFGGNLIDGRIRPRISWHGASMSFGLALVAWLYAAFPNETLLGNRDEGLYSLMALRLAQTRSVSIEMPPQAASAPALFQPLADGPPPPFFLPGVYETAQGLRLQFPGLLPAWIAQVAAATNGSGLFRSSALLSLCAVWVFFVLAHRLLRAPAAWLAVVVFALNPAQVWIARINLVEPLARLLVLGGLLAAVMAMERREARLALLAGGMFGVAAYGRLDLLMLSPLVIAAIVVMRLWPSPRFDAAVPTMSVVAVATVSAQSLAVLLLALSSPDYLRPNSEAVVAAVAFTGVALATLPLLKWPGICMLRQPAARRTLVWAVAAAVLLLLTYAALVRPRAEPFALIQRYGHPLDGTRDYREQSLLGLAAYLSWPIVLAAAFGTAIATWRVLRGRAAPALLLAALAFVPTTLALLANPHVSPDHFWAVRRFVPLAIPGVVLLAAYGVQTLLAPLAAGTRRRAVGLLALAAAARLIAVQWPTLFVQENRELSSKLAALDAALGETPLVLVRDLDALGASLAVGFGRPVLPLRDATIAIDDGTRAFWAHCTASAPCVLVHTDFQGLSGLALGSSRWIRLERRVIEQTPVPLPHGTTIEALQFALTPVLGLADRAPSTLAGAYRDWSLDDRGFHREDLLPSYSGRWTNGDAALRLPRTGADTLELRFLVPGNVPQPVRVTLDGVVLHDGPLAGAQKLTFGLQPDEGVTDSRLLTVRSPTFTPKAAGQGSDTRELGVWLAGVRQFNSAAPRLHRVLAHGAVGSRVVIAGSPFVEPLVIDSQASDRRVTMTVANEGDLVWPAGSEVGPDEVPVILGIVWRRLPDLAVVHEQRTSLPFAVRPGERLLMTPSLDSRAQDGRPMPQGDYELEIDLLQEHVAWFAQRGGEPARLRVRIGSDGLTDR
jgi:hypothetical protein